MVESMSLTLLICCHNGARRLEATLEHIQAQEVPKSQRLEVIVVDNASTDSTSEIARKLLGNSSFPWRVLYEPRLGKAHALSTGLASCTTDLISIVDDDNWLSSDWARTAVRSFLKHPDAGIIGSHNEPVFEHPPPKWFINFASKFACGPQNLGVPPGVVTDFGCVFGAGMNIRRQVWNHLQANGFYFFNFTRKGRIDSYSEDVEFCLAAASLGWRILYNPNLILKHYIPKERLEWGYLRKLSRLQGAGACGIDPYILARDSRYSGWKRRFQFTWEWQALSKLVKLFHFGPNLGRVFVPGGEGEFQILEMEILLGALHRIVRERSAYTRYLRFVEMFGD